MKRSPILPPPIDCELLHPTLPVPDIPAAIEFYTKKLGFSLGFTFGEPPTFAGVNLDKVQIFLSLGKPNPKGMFISFVVNDVDELYEFYKAGGVEIIETPGDREFGLRTFAVQDLNGYGLGFGNYIYTVGDPIPIERVKVPVRLEKRLAALLNDLAEHKRMSLSSCLEETLLHTMDDVGPHTKRQLRYIQELKRKHRIDYDSHGSYRFVEKNGKKKSAPGRKGRRLAGKTK